MSPRITLLAIVCLAVATAAASAEPYFVRTWQSPGTHFRNTFLTQIEVRPGYWGPRRGHEPRLTVAQQTVVGQLKIGRDRGHGQVGSGTGTGGNHDHGQVGPRPGPRPPYPQPPQPEPPVWHPPLYRDVWVDFSLDLAGPAPLRYGEQEIFRVHARPLAGQRAFVIGVQATDSVWSYLGQNECIVRVDAMGGGYVPVRFLLTPTRRHPVRPPNTIAGLRIGTRGENDPIVLEWEDVARTDDGNAASVYLFKIARSRFLLPDKTIAEGSLQPADFAPHQTVTITKGGRFQQFDEYLRNGSKYVVTVQVQKVGSDYTNEPSEAARLEFTFNAAQSTYSREASRAVNFRQLYRRR